jgi:hypothetical protein
VLRPRSFLVPQPLRELHLEFAADTPSELVDGDEFLRLEAGVRQIELPQYGKGKGEDDGIRDHRFGP